MAAAPALLPGPGGGMTRGVTVHLVVRTADMYGCPLRAGGDAVAATLKSRVDVGAAVVDNGDGSYNVSFTPAQAVGRCSLNL